MTFLLTWRLDESSLAGRANWWVHALVILGFLALIPGSKHLHLMLSPYHARVADEFLADLAGAVAEHGESRGVAARYGGGPLE